jgi:hypothetical protein
MPEPAEPAPAAWRTIAAHGAARFGRFGAFCEDQGVKRRRTTRLLGLALGAPAHGLADILAYQTGPGAGAGAW